MATAFFSYSHKDEALRDELEVHLALLKREGTIETWHDRRIPVGDVVDTAIDENLQHAAVILLLVSPDFLASRYCYEVEVIRAMERHRDGTARVIPVILRPCDWQRAPFGSLLAAPKDGKPVTRWPDRDEAFLDVVGAIRRALEKSASRPATAPTAPHVISPPSNPPAATPRSSNLRVKKEFTDADKDKFVDDAFQFIALFFQNSLAELQQRNVGIETRFRKLDSDAFSAVVYRHGNVAAKCGIRRATSGGMGNGITFSYDENAPRDSFNESLSVIAGDQSLYLKALGLFMISHINHLTPEGAAELFWAKFIERMQ